MKKEHPHAGATYQIVQQLDGSFGVEVTIPDTYPTMVTGFSTEAAAAAWATKHKEEVANGNSLRRTPLFAETLTAQKRLRRPTTWRSSPGRCPRRSEDLVCYRGSLMVWMAGRPAFVRSVPLPLEAPFKIQSMSDSHRAQQYRDKATDFREQAAKAFSQDLRAPAPRVCQAL